MPKTIISEGKTTNEAIENGLKELNVTKNDVEIKWEQIKKIGEDVILVNIVNYEIK